VIGRTIKRAGQSRAVCAVTAVLMSMGLLALSPAFGGPSLLTTKKAKRIFVTK
jgi:hypothetical protein